MGDTHVQQLEDGRFVRAVWVPGADLWYYVEAEHPELVTARTLEQLAELGGVRTYATRGEAEQAARTLGYPCRRLASALPVHRPRTRQQE